MTDEKRPSDGLTRWQRYRLKDLEGYRRRKREYIKTPEQRAKRAAYQRKWREANRDKHNRQARESHARNGYKHINRNRDNNLRRSYGITLADKIAMIEQQKGLCGICGRPFLDTRRIHVDHCHRSGKIRGILCNVCNTKLEWFELNRAAIHSYVDAQDAS